MLAKLFDINLTDIDALVLTSPIYSWKDNLTNFWHSLSSQEKERAHKFITQDLKDKFIISHGLLRHILSIYCKAPSQNIYYRFNDFNKPYLGNHENIVFNISHSRDYIAFIISTKTEVGIDIEWENPNIKIEELKESVFTLEESKYFLSIKDNQKLQAFYNIWVKKEAIIKAIGQGCYYNIQNINTRLNNSLFSYHEYQYNKYYYTTLQKLNKYYLAISLLNIIPHTIGYYEI